MDELATAVRGYLQALCGYPDRHPGRAGNRAATELFARVAAESGLEVEVAELDCVDWESGGAELRVGESAAPALPYDVRPGPYSLPCVATGILRAASAVEELEASGRGEDGGFAGSVLLVLGELAREQLTPRGYPFYEMPGHERILDALEAARPAAIVAATGRNPDLVGGLYPFPLVEDAEFRIPTAFMTDVEGERLAAHAGETVTLRIDSRRIPATAQHVVARAWGSGSGRIVVFGHVDSKAGTPGALDNATGAAALMALAGLLRDYRGRYCVELVPLNGEDYYDATGEKRFAADNAGRWNEIALGLNADGAGWRDHPTEISLYGCDDAVAGAVRAAMVRRRDFAEGEPWYQSDHGLFLLNGRPAVAVTSNGFAELCAKVTHTSRDTLDLVDPEKVAEIARFYADVIATLP